MKKYTILAILTVVYLFILSWQQHFTDMLYAKPALSSLAGKPTPGIESIKVALTNYNIDATGVDVSYYNNMSVRGTCYSRGNIRKVVLSSYAFESWGILASTLAHEIEIHARHSLLVYIIGRYDVGRAWAELTAYSHEIRWSGRFGTERNFLHQLRFDLSNQVKLNNKE